MDIVKILPFFLICIGTGYFKGSPYVFITEDIKLYNIDPNFGTVKYKVINRNTTQGGVNVTVTNFMECNNTFRGHANLYKLFQNGKLKKVFEISLKACQLLDGNYTKYDLSRMIHAETNVTGCPVKEQSTHYGNNIIPKPENFPSVLPTGKFLIKIDYLIKETSVGTLEWILYILRRN